MAGLGEDEADITRVMTEYKDAYIAMDAHRIATFFDEPHMVLAQNASPALATRGELETWLRPVLERLKDRGYARSDYKNLRVKSFGNGIAIVSTGFTRYKADGTILETQGATYLLRKDTAGWKIAVVTVHTPDAALSLP
jgi:ketosteroid isomerase-like protein